MATKRQAARRDSIPTIAPSKELLEQYEAERPGRHRTARRRSSSMVLPSGLSIFAIVWVLNPIATETYRSAFLAVALLLTFLVFTAPASAPAAPSTRARTRRCSTGRRGWRRSSRSATPPSTPTRSFRRAAAARGRWTSSWGICHRSR